jgi:hypothetical protein
MKKERIVVPIKEFLSEDTSDGRGTFSGYCNLKGYLEERYGSIFVEGSYAETIPIFVREGFVADSHGAALDGDYTVLTSYGTVIDAREDSKGLFFKGKFHSTPEAQNLRTICRERADDQKTVGMSIGFYTLESFRVFPKDYDRVLKNYLSPEYLQQGLEAAKDFSSILIRTKVQIFENSLTLMPAMAPALVKEVQSMKETLGKYLGDYVENSMSLQQVTVLVDALYWNAAYTAFCNDQMSTEERRALWAGALQEFMDYNLQIFDNHESWEAGEPASDEEQMSRKESGEFLQSMFCDPKVFSPLKGMFMKEHEAAVLGAVKSFLTRQMSLAESNGRKKQTLSGKSVSKTNHAALKEVSSMIGEHCSGMTECKQSLDDFLDKHDPNKTEDDAETESRALALRAKLLQRKFSQPILN